MITLAGVGCRLGGRWVLLDVSLNVAPGEIVGLAGPSGSGKSLLLAVCATLVRADAGDIRIAGRDPRKAPAAVRATIGYVSDETGYDPRMTVAEDLAFFARAHGLARAAAREAVRDAIVRWQLGEVAELTMAAASRGWRRRVALARATLHRPAVLLLDDPADGLDADGRERLAHELRRHADAGGSALVAASRPDDLDRATHRTVRLAAGRLLVAVDGALSTTTVVDGAVTPAGRA